MYRIQSFIIPSILLLLLPGCLFYPIKKKKVSDESAVTPNTVVVDERVPPASLNYTFLDTINRGNELLLTEADFEKSNQTTESDGSSLQTPPETRYRVQILASNRIEAAREQKKELEKKVKETLVIGYEAPYYKLYAGSFVKRRDAQVLLLKIKKLGFLDAWIVSTSVTPEN